MGVALTPEDLPEAALLAAARSAGLSPDAARLARRITLWARDWDGAAGGTSFASNATTQPHPPTGCARIRRLRGGARPLSPDLVDLERATGTVRMRYDHTHEAFRPAALADEAAAARGWVTRLLGLAAPGAWYRMDDLIELIWRVNPYFLRVNSLPGACQSGGWSASPMAAHCAPPSARSGTRRRARTCGRCWRDRCTLGRARSGGRWSGTPRLFRLPPLGSALLARTPRHAQETSGEMARAAAQALSFDSGPVAALTKEGALAVQPLAAPPALLDALEQWAEVTSLAGGRLLYTFAARALARYDEGMEPERALTPLRAAGLVRAAQTLAPRLESWRQGYGDARLTGGLASRRARRGHAARGAGGGAGDSGPRTPPWPAAVMALSHADAETLRAALAKKGWEL